MFLWLDKTSKKDWFIGEVVVLDKKTYRVVDLNSHWVVLNLEEQGL
jgi:hypothetical protein